MRFKDILNNDGSPNWDFIQTIPEFAKLKLTEQNSVYHEEGNVWNHTKLVTEQMAKLLDYDHKIKVLTDTNIESDNVDRKALILSAILHDIGKGETTYWDEMENTWKTRNHGRVGEQIVRRMFFNETNVKLREKVCWLVRWHMMPHHIFDSNNRTEIMRRFKRISNGNASLTELCYLNYADSVGSVSKDTRDGDEVVIERIRRILVGCTSDRPIITVMIGISGSGKTSWANDVLPSTPVISRDVIREQLGYTKPGEKAKLSKQQENEVTDEFYRIALDYLSKGENIVIDNMNLKRVYRDEYKKRFSAYNPKYRYVYVEAPSLEDNILRREGQVSEAEIRRMLDTMEFPEPEEYDDLIISKQV